MAKDFSSMEDSNRSTNPSIHQVSDPGRRIVLHGGLGAALQGLMAPLAAGGLIIVGSSGGEFRIREHTVDAAVEPPD